MRITVRAAGFELADALKDHVERRLLFALGRFVQRVASVSVRLEDVNGARGETDKRCVMVVRLKPRGHVLVECADSDVYAAIDRTADRVDRAVARENRARGRETRSLGASLRSR